MALDLLSRLSIKNGFWRLAWYFLENCTVIFVFKVPVDEVLHIGELIQTSSRTGLYDTSKYCVILELNSILALCFVLPPDHCQGPHHEKAQKPDSHCGDPGNGQGGGRSRGRGWSSVR